MMTMVGLLSAGEDEAEGGLRLDLQKCKLSTSGNGLSLEIEAVVKALTYQRRRLPGTLTDCPRTRWGERWMPVPLLKSPAKIIKLQKMSKRMANSRLEVVRTLCVLATSYAAFVKLSASGRWTMGGKGVLGRQSPM